MKYRVLAVAFGFWLAAATPVPAGVLTATEVLALRAGRGPGAMRILFDPVLIEYFAVDSQGRFLVLDRDDGPGTIHTYAPNGKFLRRIPVLRPGERPWPARAYHLWVDGVDNMYVNLGAYKRVRKFDREGHFVRDVGTQDAGPRYVDRRGHIFGHTLVGVIKELDSDGQLVREVQGLKHPLNLLVDTRGEILFREGPAPAGIPIAPELSPDRGDLFRDRQGNYYYNLPADGICANFYIYGPDRQQLLREITHVELMQRMGYRHQAVEYLRNGGRKPSTTGGRFCTLGWYLSTRDEFFALVASDSLPKGQPWLRVLRVEIR